MNRRLWQIWWITLAVKVILAVAIPISHDEAYYWVWSHHPQLSYFDHPGMISWLFWLGHPLEFIGTAVRLPIVVLGHMSVLIWLALLNDLGFSTQQKKVWLALALTSPFLGLGSLLALPDTPLLFFSSLAVWSGLRGLKSIRGQGHLWWSLSGFALGLGFCSKYHVVVVALALSLWIIISGEWRKLSPQALTLFFFSGVLGSLPVLVWNSQNEWKSFLFQLNHGLGQEHWQWDWTLGYIGGELMLLFPVVVYWALRSRPKGESSLLQALAWTPLIFFFLSSFRAAVELNWPLSAVPAVFALAVARQDKWKSYLPGLALWTSLSVFVLVYLFFPFLQNPTDKLNEVHYFDPVLPIAEDHSPLYLGTYQMAATFSYHYKRPMQKLYAIARHDFFDDLQKTPQTDTHFFLIKETWVPLPEWAAHYKVLHQKDYPPKFELLELEKP